MKVPLTVAVGLAFADASIVALALPAIYARFDTTIVGVSWVLTGYAVAVTVAALAVVVTRRWLRPMPLAVAGLVLFGAGSAWCGVAGSLTALMAGRVTQGIGAAALLAGALDLLCAGLGRERGRRLWSGAATAGLAVGPALGGALTEAFDWRIIFLAQVPVALLALVALAVRQPAAAPVPDEPEPDPRPSRWAVAGYVTLFAGLVGALFLGVLLLVEIWRFGPLVAAVVMMALPAGTLLAGRLTAAAPPAPRIFAGSLGLAAGLLALALLPGVHAGWVAVALFVCGAGAGMVMRALSATAVPGAGGVIVAAKHAGLVLGLVVIAPLLAGSLTGAAEDAAVTGTGVLLDARMPVQDKVRLALTVRDTFADTPRGSVPDLSAAIEATEDGAASTAVVEEVDDRLAAVLTRAFRPAFAIAAGLALLTAAFAFTIRRQRRYAGAGPALATLGLLVLLGPAIVAAEVSAGAGDFGRYSETDACAAPADPYPGDGVDALVQRVAYGALHGAACELGLSRERFVLALAGQPGFAEIEWDQPTVERAVRGAADRALDDVDQRDDLPGWMVALVRTAVDKMPLAELLRAAGFN